MEEQEKTNREEGASPPEQDTRSAWQRNKEELYDRVPMTVKQLDIIIALGWIGLAVVAVLIALEAAGIL